MRRLATGWGFSGISTFRTGFPVTFDAPTRLGITPLSLTGSGTGQPVRPNVAGPFSFNPQPAGSAQAPNGLNNDPVQKISAYAASLGLSEPLLETSARWAGLLTGSTEPRISTGTYTRTHRLTRDSSCSFGASSTTSSTTMRFRM
jgi:hypothetical protein